MVPVNRNMAQCRTGKPTLTLIVLYDLHAVGARTIRSFLRLHGYEVNLIFFKDYVGLSRAYLPTRGEVELLMEQIENFDSDVIGLSVSWSAISAVAEFVFKEIRSRSKVPILTGGIHAVMDPEESATWSDVVCIGEGEHAMLEYLERFGEGRDIDDIQDLWVRKDGDVIRNEKRPPAADLDEFGITDFDDADQVLIENGTATVGDPRKGNIFVHYPYASRGCPMQCTFCSSPVQRRAYMKNGKFLRTRSVSKVIEEMRLVQSVLGKRYVFFLDDIFGLSLEWLEEFAEAYPREIGTSFGCHQYPTTATDRTMNLIKKAGAERVNIGLQSGSERIRKEIYKRGETNKQVRTAMANCVKYGIRPQIDFIDNVPWETDEDRVATLDLLLSLPRPFILQLASLQYLPGVELTKRAIAEGLTERPYQQEEMFIRKELANGAPEETQEIKTGGFFGQTTPTQKYWRGLYTLAGKRFFPRTVVRFLASLPVLRRFPTPLHVLALITTILAQGTRGLGMFLTGRLSLRMARNIVGTALRLQR